jgi:hypothetical protein
MVNYKKTKLHQLNFLSCLDFLKFKHILNYSMILDKVLFDYLNILSFVCNTIINMKHKICKNLSFYVFISFLYGLESFFSCNFCNFYQLVSLTKLKAKFILLS